MNWIRALIGAGALRLARACSPEVVEALRARAFVQGNRDSRDQLRRELAYSIEQRGLLRAPAARHIHPAWKRAFELLCSEHAGDTTSTCQSLTALGFTAAQANYMVFLRDQEPERLVTLLLAVLGGLTDAQAWAITAEPQRRAYAA